MNNNSKKYCLTSTTRQKKKIVRRKINTPTVTCERDANKYGTVNIGRKYHGQFIYRLANVYVIIFISNLYKHIYNIDMIKLILSQWFPK
jgi:hypothetical protein